MDPGTLIGIGLAFFALLVSLFMEGADPMSIILLPPMILVLGGTFGAAMAGGLMKDATRIGFWLKTAMMSKKPATAVGLVDTLVKLADRARREGLLALEEGAQEVEDPFLRRGLELAIDGTDPEELRDILDGEIAAKRAEFKAGSKLFQDMGGYAPTMGIVGTVIGLIHVLGNLSTPEKLGHLIAGAFVATLWGVMSANFVWLPLGNKVKRLGDYQVQQMELMVEGILSIQAGVNPRLIQQKLHSLLPPADREAGKKAADAEAEAA